MVELLVVFAIWVVDWLFVAIERVADLVTWITGDDENVVYDLAWNTLQQIGYLYQIIDPID